MTCICWRPAAWRARRWSWARPRGYGAPLTCANCHKPAPDGGFVKIDMPKDCGACHSLTFARKNGVDQQLKHGHPDRGRGAAETLLCQPAAISRPGPNSLSAARACAAPRPAAGRPVDYVADSVRAAFERGGTCTTCHTFIKPAAGLAGIPDPAGAPDRPLPALGRLQSQCARASQGRERRRHLQVLPQGRKLQAAPGCAAAQDRRMRHLPRQDQGRDTPWPRRAAIAPNATDSTIRACRPHPGAGNWRKTP